MSSRRSAVYALTILCLFAGLFTGRAFFFNLAYLLAGLVLLAMVWAWFSLRWITFSRKTRARRAQVGRPIDESFAIINHAWFPKLWLEIRDYSTLPNHHVSQVVPGVTPRQTYRWHVETPCVVRGEFQLGPVTISSGDPFGLFTLTRKLNATSTVIVYPATLPLDHVELPIGQLTGGDARRKKAFHITTNAAGVREYAPGDSINRIHWASTARTGNLMVKEFEIDPLVDVWLFPDFSSASVIEEPSVERDAISGTVIPTQPGIPPSSEEYAVVIAASLAKYFIDSERALGFAAYLPYRQIIQPERGTHQLSRILHSLAVARSKTPYTFAQMLALEAPYLTRGTTLLLITSSVDPAWITQAQILEQRGIRSMCILIDPASFFSVSSANDASNRLRVARIPTIIVRKNDDLATILKQKPI